MAASWLTVQARDGVGLAFCSESPLLSPSHVIAFEEERVNSSGSGSEKSNDEGEEDSKCVFFDSRQLT